MITAFLQRTSGKSHTNITPQSNHPYTTSNLQESEVPWQDNFANEIVNVNNEIKSLSLHSSSDHGFGSDSSDGSAGGLAPDLDDIDALDLFGDSVPMPVVSKEEVVLNNHLWSPFRSEDDFSACLMMGYLHNILSRTSYLQIRHVLGVRKLKVELPYWDAVRRSKARIRKLLNFELKETISVWNNKCYTISLKGILANELLNPYVTQYLEYYPHDPSGTTINSLHQCIKWREDLSRDDLCTIGHPAYDCELEADVLVMSVAMAFLAGSPMHAEITNTPLPGNANSPCRICQLYVAKKDDKTLVGYVKDFMGITYEGNVLPPLRDWKETISRTHQLWETAKTKPRDDYDDEARLYGLKDNINSEMVTRYKQRNKPGQKEAILAPEKTSRPRLFSPIINCKCFDGCKDSPVEILHVVQLGMVKYLVAAFMITFKDKDALKLKLQAYWNSFNTESLNIPYLKPAYMVTHWASFIGKDYKTVVQAAPFVFFPFMKPAQRELWTSLCYLTSFIFQTQVEDLNQYATELKLHTDRFLYNTLKMSAQWVNKPKFHILTHLYQSVLRYGPPSLFASEKFESFNSNVRRASGHSNRHSPGRDIAITFSDLAATRLIVSVLPFLIIKESSISNLPANVTDVFKNSKGIQNYLAWIKLFHHPIPA
ncbi:hypothetical protein PSTT_06948 [Puccinia striiformis]|uniref:Uncharacterized protein n=1 Tax=Puccinia striiformis TaxID=27350 RepID=A0A2S4VI66_9BASI|nr:hypothetical protein PSTT_06948 [Puccinia striiformis]